MAYSREEEKAVTVLEEEAGMAIMEERLQLDVKAWLTSKERARIEVSETSTISRLMPRRGFCIVDMRKRDLYLRRSTQGCVRAEVRQ